MYRYAHICIYIFICMYICAYMRTWKHVHHLPIFANIQILIPHKCVRTYTHIRTQMKKLWNIHAQEASISRWSASTTTALQVDAYMLSISISSNKTKTILHRNDTSLSYTLNNKPKVTHTHISRNRGINRIKSSDHLRQSYGALPQGVSTERDTYSTDIAVDDMQQQNKKIKKKSKKKRNVKVR